MGLLICALGEHSHVSSIYPSDISSTSIRVSFLHAILNLSCIICTVLDYSVGPVLLVIFVIQYAVL